MVMETAHEQPATTVTELAAPIGLGRTAEVYAWGDNSVLKLLRPGFPDLLGELEANVAALVSRASVGAPRFIGTVRLEGRFGLIYERLAGPSMLDGLSARPWQIDRLARRFAELHAVMHEAAGSGLLPSPLAAASLPLPESEAAGVSLFSAGSGMKMSGHRSLPEWYVKRTAASAGVPSSHR